MKRSKLKNYNILPKEIEHHLFSYLSTKELQKNKLVSKSYLRNINEFIKGTSQKNNLIDKDFFYVTGNSIRTSDIKSVLNPTMYPFIPRQRIPYLEIINSFLNKNSFKVFFKKNDAVLYSFYQAKGGFNSDWFQPPIFKVKILNRNNVELSNNILKEKFTYFNSKNLDGGEKLSAEVRYFKANSSDVIPISGQMITLEGDSNREPVKLEYPVVSFKTPPKIKKKNNCLIM